jgi:hypothetical protein
MMGRGKWDSRYLEELVVMMMVVVRSEVAGSEERPADGEPTL